MNIEETYRALIEAIAAYVMAVAHDAASGATKDSPSAKKDMIAAVRAHGAARELKGHVDACILRDWSVLPEGADPTVSEAEKLLPKCGDGPDSPPFPLAKQSGRTGAGRGQSWLCDVGKEIEELGR